MNKYLTITLKVVVAVILLQTLFFKFTGHEESIYIFTKVGMEPYGRILTGVVELIASILLFVPGLNWLGALLALGACSGAAFFHLTILGIEVMMDNGALFFMALLVIALSALLLWNYKSQIPYLNLGK
jgi:uncharacterized membrane protein YphA (DoxX/SURF4 family)